MSFRVILLQWKCSQTFNAHLTFLEVTTCPAWRWLIGMVHTFKNKQIVFLLFGQKLRPKIVDRKDQSLNHSLDLDVCRIIANLICNVKEKTSADYLLHKNKNKDTAEISLVSVVKWWVKQIQQMLSCNLNPVIEQVQSLRNTMTSLPNESK